MNEMTLPSRHRIKNSSPGGLVRARYLSAMEVPHNIEHQIQLIEMLHNGHPSKHKIFVVQMLYKSFMLAGI